MSSKIKIGMIAIMLIAASGAFAVSAYTSGSVERSANVDVVNDDVGLIGLDAGTAGGIVSMTNGELGIDFRAGSADGVNANATFKLGDPADATNVSAFNITNLDAESHDFTVSYTSDAADQDPDSNIKFEVYDNTGTLVDTADEEGASANLTGVASGETYYVVIVVDTHGLDNTDNLTGTLKISA